MSQAPEQWVVVDQNPDRFLGRRVYGPFLALEQGNALVLRLLKRGARVTVERIESPEAAEEAYKR